MRIAAVERAVRERPQSTCRFSFKPMAADDLSPDRKQQFAALAKAYRSLSPHGKGSSSATQAFAIIDNVAPFVTGIK